MHQQHPVVRIFTENLAVVWIILFGLNLVPPSLGFFLRRSTEFIDPYMLLMMMKMILQTSAIIFFFFFPVWKFLLYLVVPCKESVPHFGHPCHASVIFPPVPVLLFWDKGIRTIYVLLFYFIVLFKWFLTSDVIFWPLWSIKLKFCTDMS